MNWVTVVATILGSVVMAAVTVLTARIGARTSKHATDVGAAVAEEMNAVQGFHILVGDLQAEVATLRQEMSKLRSDHEELQRHVRVLESRRARDRSLIRALYDYAQRLRAALLRASLPVPEPPSGLDLDEPLTD